MCRSDLAVGRGGIQPTPMRTYRRRASREGLVGSGRRAEPWACSASSRGATGGRIVLFGRSPPPLRHTSSTLSRAAAPVCGALVPSERQWATQLPRSGGVRASRTVERRAGRTTAPAASCCGVMGGGAAPTTRAACAARARLSAEGHRARRCPSTAAPHRPAAPGRRVASRFDRRRCGRACTDMRRGAGHASGSGKDRCARCACRDRPGAPWGSNPNRRLPCGDHFARAMGRGGHAQVPRVTSGVGADPGVRWYLPPSSAGYYFSQNPEGKLSKEKERSVKGEKNLGVGRLRERRYRNSW